MIPSARAAALRSTALATSLALAVGLAAFPLGCLGQAKSSPAEAAADFPQRDSKAHGIDQRARRARPACGGPRLRPRPLLRRQFSRLRRASMPPCRNPRKHVAPAAVAATSSTSQADKDALENVIELVRKQKPGDANQAQATISDPVARKLAEWLILRSDNNGASVERYRAFVSANPSWPSQTFLRRRIEAALWDDRRDDASGLVLVRKRIADFGQGQVRAGEGHARARRSHQCRTAGPRGLAP